jgi:hypothetical protein
MQQSLDFVTPDFAKLETEKWLKRFSAAKKVTKPMTLDESRKVFPYRPFLVINGKVFIESRFGSADGDEALMGSKLGSKCRMCPAPTEKKWLKNGICPDCDGRAEANGAHPRKK